LQTNNGEEMNESNSTQQDQIEKFDEKKAISEDIKAKVEELNNLLSIAHEYGLKVFLHSGWLTLDNRPEKVSISIIEQLKF